MLYLSYLATVNSHAVFEIIDVFGQTVKAVPVNSVGNFKEIPVDDLADGLYVWRFKDEKRAIKTGRVILQK